MPEVKKKKKRTDLRWSTEKRKLSELKEYGRNPRLLTEYQYKQLATSFDNFDYVELMAIDTDNTIVAGHQRLKVLTHLYGEDAEIEVRVPNRKLTDKEFEEYLLRSNKNTGEFDYEMLANQYEMEVLYYCGFTDEDFGVVLENEPSDDKKKKPKVTIEFKDEEILEQYLPDLKNIAESAQAKIKMKD